MVERCARRSLTAMHYLARIYSASALSEGLAHTWGPNVCAVFPSLTLNRRANKGIRQRVTTSMCNNCIYCICFTFFFFFVGTGRGWGGCFVFHIPLVKMHERHNPGTVTHWPTSTEKNFFFSPLLCLDKHTDKVFLKRGEGEVVWNRRGGSGTIDLCKGKRNP